MFKIKSGLPKGNYRYGNYICLYMLDKSVNINSGVYLAIHINVAETHNLKVNMLNYVI